MAASVDALFERFKIRYPEFDGVDGDVVKLSLSDAMTEVSPRVWGKLYERGVCALAAHLLYSKGWPDADGLASGDVRRMIAGQSADGLSESFGGPAVTTDEADYQTSGYGQDYKRLQKLVRRHVIVT